MDSAIVELTHKRIWSYTQGEFPFSLSDEVWTSASAAESHKTRERSLKESPSKVYKWPSRTRATPTQQIFKAAESNSEFQACQSISHFSTHARALSSNTRVERKRECLPQWPADQYTVVLYCSCTFPQCHRGCLLRDVCARAGTRACRQRLAICRQALTASQRPAASGPQQQQSFARGERITRVCTAAITLRLVVSQDISFARKGASWPL